MSFFILFNDAVTIKTDGVSDKFINEYGAVVGMRVGGWNQGIQRKPLPLTLYPP
jgi:hypothetical protein